MYVYRLSNELARRGHHVTVVHCADAFDAMRGPPAGEFANHPNVTVHTLASRFGRVSPLVTYLSGRPGLKAKELTRILGQPFDVVHFHNVSLIGGPGVLELGSGVKLYTTHEHWLVCPMHVLWKNDREPCEQPQCLRCTLAFRRPPQLWRYGGAARSRHQRSRPLPLAEPIHGSTHTASAGSQRPMRHLPLFLPRAEAAPACARTCGDTAVLPLRRSAGADQGAGDPHRALPLVRRRGPRRRRRRDTGGGAARPRRGPSARALPRASRARSPAEPLRRDDGRSSSRPPATRRSGWSRSRRSRSGRP